MRLHKPEDNPWGQQLLVRLEAVHPRLRKVFLSGNENCVWTLRGNLGTWERRSLRGYSAWSLVSGMYDNLWPCDEDPVGKCYRT